MSLMPQICDVECGGNSVRLTLHISPALDYFPGHFPGFPILPGVVQVDWVMRLAREYLGIPDDGFSALRALKFSSPVLPDTYLSLEINWQNNRQRLDFTYRTDERIVASGQIIFAAEARI